MADAGLLSGLLLLGPLSIAGFGFLGKCPDLDDYSGEALSSEILRVVNRLCCSRVRVSGIMVR